jgi:hypothetical protein
VPSTRPCPAFTRTRTPGGLRTPVVAGHRRAAWCAVGPLWAAHLLIAHWLYAYLPPPGDEAAPWGREVFVTAWVVAIVAASELVRVRREARARERAERAAAERRRLIAKFAARSKGPAQAEGLGG